MKKLIYKNSRAIVRKVEGKFYGVVDPSTANSLRLLNQDQIDLFNSIDGTKDLSEILNETKIPKVNAEQFINQLERAKLLTNESKTKLYKVQRAHSLNIWVHMTDKCNLRCSYCYVSTLDTYKTMSKDVLDRIKYKLIEQMDNDRDLSSIHLKLSGGEIFSKFNYWKDVVRGWKADMLERNVTPSIVCLTNMTILSDEILSYVKEMDIALGISLDGIGDFHDANRVFINKQGTYDTIIKNIEKLEKYGIRFSISTTVTNANIDGLSELIKFLVIKGHTFLFTNVKGQEVDMKRFVDSYEKCFEILEDYVGKEFSMKHGYNQCDLTLQAPDGNICGMGKNGGAIYVDGDVYFCHTHFGSHDSLGSIFEEDKLLTLLQRGDKYNTELSDDCKSCSYQLVCSGGCPVYRKDGKSIYCEFYRSTLPRVYELMAKEMLVNERQKQKNKAKQKVLEVQI